MDTETCRILYRFSVRNWPTGQIWSTLGFCRQNFIGIEPHIHWLLTVYGWFRSGMVELSSRDGQEMAGNT